LMPSGGSGVSRITQTIRLPWASIKANRLQKREGG
jgi:hypothetical protein